jgi:hypothetical protein
LCILHVRFAAKHRASERRKMVLDGPPLAGALEFPHPAQQHAHSPRPLLWFNDETAEA